jgi:hypothetical protein
MSEATLRQYLKRRVWWCAGVAICGWLLLALASAIGKHMPDGVPAGGIVVAGFLLFGGAIFALQRIVKCPKCKARLGQTIAMPLAFSWGRGPKVNFCPYCGVNLDQAMPRSESVAQSQDPIHPA